MTNKRPVFSPLKSLYHLSLSASFQQIKAVTYQVFTTEYISNLPLICAKYEVFISFCESLENRFYGGKI